MSQLSINLKARREELGLKVADVQKEMNRLGHDVAFSTVAGWFNGSRGIGDMDHLIALCRVLKTDLDSMTKGEIELLDNNLDILLSREVRQLSDEQKEMLIALARNMRPK